MVNLVVNSIFTSSVDRTAVDKVRVLELGSSQADILQS